MNKWKSIKNIFSRKPKEVKPVKEEPVIKPIIKKQVIKTPEFVIPQKAISILKAAKTSEKKDELRAEALKIVNAERAKKGLKEFTITQLDKEVSKGENNG